jgi:predicted phosphodiesterase
LTKDTNQFLIFGGAYSNLEATKALFKEAKLLGIAKEHIYCMGDIVAYCADPLATSKLIKESGITCLLGNCEESLASSNQDCGCGFEEGMTCAILSEQWYGYASAQMDPEILNWMAHLPKNINLNLAGHQITLVHGSYSSINQFIFESTEPSKKNQELIEADKSIIIGSHCGIPFGQKLKHGYWLNCGAIGLPANDGTQDGWFLTLDAAADTINAQWHRLTYDFKTAARKMRSNRLNHYADTLETGLWPSMDVLPETEKSQQGIKLSPPALIVPGK